MMHLVSIARTIYNSERIAILRVMNMESFANTADYIEHCVL
jgi:hypothetical protein